MAHRLYVGGTVNDCNGEVAGAMGLAGVELQNQKYLRLQEILVTGFISSR